LFSGNCFQQIVFSKLFSAKFFEDAFIARINPQQSAIGDRL